MTNDEIRALIASIRNIDVTLEWDRSDLYTYANQLADTLETTLVRLELAEMVCEAAKGSVNANSRKELNAWYRDIESAIEQWRAIKGGDGE